MSCLFCQNSDKIEKQMSVEEPFVSQVGIAIYFGTVLLPASAKDARWDKTNDQKLDKFFN